MQKFKSTCEGQNNSDFIAYTNNKSPQIIKSDLLSTPLCIMAIKISWPQIYYPSLDFCLHLCSLLLIIGLVLFVVL